MPEPLIESSFKEYSKICPQYAQPHTQWVYWEFLIKLDPIKSFLWIHWNKPSGYIVDIFWSILWKNSQWVAQAYFRHILIKFMKETPGFFLKMSSMCPLIKMRSNWWAHFECILNAPTGLIEIKMMGIF